MSSPPDASPPRRLVLALGSGAALLAAASALLFVFGTSASRPETTENRPPRYVSLAPATTETLVALGVGERLVGVSDYCKVTKDLPRVGSAITPRYEEIARLRPTALFLTSVGGTQTAPLGRIATTHELSWLTPVEIAASLRRLGTLVGAERRADELAAKFESTFVVPTDPNAPRVLLLLGYDGTGGGTYWFVKDESVHGALLRAAGGRNAVERRTAGAPRLAVEELLRIDPTIVIVLSLTTDPAANARLFDELEKLEPLAAVRNERLGVVSDERLLDVGPSLFDFVEPLRREIRRLAEKGPR